MRGSKEIGLTVLLLVVLGLLFVAMQDTGAMDFTGLEGRARQAVEAQGYQVLEARGYEYWACGKDAQGFNFLVQNPAGVQMNVTACTENGVIGINKSWWVVSR
jgi:hypothetical protein